MIIIDPFTFIVAFTTAWIFVIKALDSFILKCLHIVVITLVTIVRPLNILIVSFMLAIIIIVNIIVIGTSFAIIKVKELVLYLQICILWLYELSIFKVGFIIFFLIPFHFLFFIIFSLRVVFHKTFHELKMDSLNKPDKAFKAFNHLPLETFIKLSMQEMSYLIYF